MLRHLAIRNYLLAGDIALDLEPGLTVLTGETGAGKSLLVDALALVLGARAEAGVVRAGAARAEIAAEFAAAAVPGLAEWLESAGFESPEDGLVLKRVIEAGGRSRAFINGSPATLAQLKEAGELLVDIHGQHAHHALLRAEVQREVLDAYAGAADLRAALARAYRDWQDALAARREAESGQASRLARRIELEAWLEELDVLEEALADWPAFEAEHTRLAHLTTLIEGSRAILEQLDDSDAALTRQLAQARNRLEALTGYDARLGEAAGLLEAAQAAVDEAVHVLNRYAGTLEFDPGRVEAVERQMGEAHRLARKHRVPPEGLAALRASLREARDALGALADLEALARAEAEARAACQTLAAELSVCRAEAAQRLAQTVTAAMHELALANGHFEVALDRLSEPRAYGLEDVRFLVTTHPGLPSGPLVRVASGGELSRISLAIQTALSGAAGVPTLVFDEVDVGIGGAVAEAVGRRLARLGENRQVLVITHLPQVAARGAHHLRVHKTQTGDAVTTAIAHLDSAARIEEIARMLGGATLTDTTRRHAAEMLAG